MLRKLLKQEFRATARVMLPLYLVTFVLALAVRLVLLLSQNQVLLDSVGGRTLRAILLGVSVTAFVVAAIATFLAALIQAVLRFRSNLLGDEGYVMFTLPVSTHQLVWAKLITSAVWFLGAAVIDALALLALVVNLGMFQEFGRFVIEVKEQLSRRQRHCLPGGVGPAVRGGLPGPVPEFLRAPGHRAQLCAA